MWGPSVKIRREKDLLEEVDVGGRIILRLIFMK